MSSPLGPGELANATGAQGLRFRLLRSNSTAYVNQLSRFYYVLGQIALGNKRCSPG